MTSWTHAFKIMDTLMNVDILNHFIIELQLKNTKFGIKNILAELNLLNKWRAFKFVIILVLKFKDTIKAGETKYSTYYSNSKAEKTDHDPDIDNAFELIYCTIMKKIEKYQVQGSDCIDWVTWWLINSMIESNIKVSKYKPMSSSSYIKLSKELKLKKILG